MEVRKDVVKMGTRIGAVIGGIAFVIFGILPGVYFGSYATLILLSKLLGGPLMPTLLVRVFTVIGIVLGLFCIGSVFIVLGAIFGTLVGYLTEAVTRGKGSTTPK